MFLISPQILFSAVSGGGGGGGSPVVSINDQAVTQSGSTVGQVAGYRLESTGIAQARHKSVRSTLETWLISGVVSDYVAYVTYIGDTPTGTIGSEISLSGSPEWTLSAAPMEILSCDLTVQIRDAVSHAVLDTCTVQLTSEQF